MKCSVQFGGLTHLELSGAVLIYRSPGSVFATWHDAETSEGEAPRLGPATPLSHAFVEELAAGLGSSIRPEILPANVLVRTTEVLVWWTPAVSRQMFFRTGDELGRISGQMFPQPALVFRVVRSKLWIRALAKSERPGASTALKVAPYHNVNSEGLVCQGSMRSPDGLAVTSMPLWEKAFFESEFTHVYGGGHLTRHPKGIAGLWRSMAGRRRFPVESLVDAEETLQQFAESKE